MSEISNVLSKDLLGGSGVSPRSCSFFPCALGTQHMAATEEFVGALLPKSCLSLESAKHPLDLSGLFGTALFPQMAVDSLLLKRWHYMCLELRTRFSYLCMCQMCCALSRKSRDL